jgi:hypothetical protein
LDEKGRRRQLSQSLPVAQFAPEIDLEQFLGPAFLSYAANVPLADVTRTYGRPSDPKHPAVDTVLTVCRSAADTPTELLEYLSRRAPGGDASVANALRLAAGGDIGEVEGDDALTRALEEMARDIYPVLLVPPFRMYVEIPIHSSVSHVANALSNHPVLGELGAALESPPFDNAFGGGIVPLFTLPDGSGQGIQEDAIPLALIGSAAAFTVLSTGGLQRTAFLREVRARAQALKDTCEGNETRVFVLTAMRGLSLAEPDLHAELPWGYLISDGRLFKSVAGDFLEGEYLALAVDGSARIEIGDARDPGWVEPPDRNRQSLDRKVAQSLLKTQLTVLAGIDKPQRLGLLPAQQMTVGPFFGAGHAISGPQPPVRHVGSRVEAVDLESLGDFARQVERTYGPRLDVAIRRICLGVASREDPGDGLVDAVIAWENLFGSRQGELRLRVSAAIAWLLAEAPDERQELSQEVRSIYDIRSSTVHGAQSGADLESRRNRAITLGAQALHALVTQRPDLIPMDSGDRSLSLLLDLPPRG